MPQIIISAKATRDLKNIREYLLQFNAEAAQKAAVTIIEATNQILTHPMIGKPLEDVPEYREIVRPFGSGSYTIRYRVNFDKIIILGIKHSKEKALYTL
ncbi:type II toxin-antitoxin system RelE/ParE family toxin [Candidatus Nomurabacteria bacterium]|nr:type II toxin-antitoxin system RelE/ParE family toxin [Candidatus Nomurabacteria bacterium]